RRVDVHDVGRVVVQGGVATYPYFRVNGQKMWITNGSLAGVMTLYARTDRGPTGFMLDAHQEGLLVGKDEEKMGQRGSATNELALRDVRIPIDGVIGVEGRGQENALETLNVGRAGLAVTSVGLIHEVVGDVREAFRAQGREPSPCDLLELGRIAVDLVASESLAYQLVGRFDHKGTKSIRVESAAGKAETSEALHRVLTRAERLVGPAGCLAEGLLEKRRRDARVLTIYEGTNEVQRFLILKDLVDALSVEPPPLEVPEVTSAGVAAGLTALAASRAETLRRAAQVRATLGSKAWQNVALQPWLFPLVEAYVQAAALSATVRRVALAHRLLSDDRGRPRLEFLERALKLLAASVAEGCGAKLAEFDLGAQRSAEGGDLWTQTLSDRALLAHAAREEAPPERPASRLDRPLRVLVLIDPAPAAAPRPRIVGGRLAEPWVELSDADRGALRDVLALRAAGEVEVFALGVGGPAAAAALEETLALGADRALLIDVGRRALLAAEVAAFTAEVVRTEEDLLGAFDWIVGAEAHAGLLLPLARRLGLDAVRGVAAYGVVAEGAASTTTATLRLEGADATTVLSGPAVLLTQATATPAEFPASIGGLRRARRLGVRAVEYAPRDAAEGALKPVERAAEAAAAKAEAGPLDVAAAARVFAEEAGLSGGAPVDVQPYAGTIDEIAVGDALADAAAAAVLAADGGELKPTARSTVDAARFLARGGRTVALVVAPGADEAATRALSGAPALAGVDVVVLTDPALDGLPDARLGRALEGAFGASKASAVFGAELRGAGLVAAEGRAMGDEALILVDGVDRLAESAEGVVASGARLDGRARYEVVRPVGTPMQVLARAEIDVAAPPRAAAPGRVAVVVEVPAPSADDDLARALRAARGALGVASLADAEFILDVGYGVGSRDGLEEVVEPMKQALERLGVRKVSVGASRKVTQDLGILPDSLQIGQTGVSVNPKLMIALGVSGAPQHLNYIGERAVIFAFNKDPEAPLMVLNRARPRPRVFPIVGDLFVEAPRFVRALEQEVGAPA
ncbi:MAG TPA: acyl-CoA dehydrogenase family protein, partial [Planctomycetota bacterium]|nr:acyl-CoA dehydrogenase family protein [Planctomycetota bacterium]